MCLVAVGAAARAGGLHLVHGVSRVTPPILRVQHPHQPLVVPKPPGGHGHHGGHRRLLFGSVVDVSVLLGVIALVAVAVLVALSLARSGWRRPSLPRFSLDPVDGGDDAAGATAPDAMLVAEGALAALTGLDSDADPRAAVIAAYAGMVAALDAAGADRAAVLTPGRLLLRAAAAGLIDGGDARSLTTLFELARFSTHEITPADVADARARLDAVRRRLPVAAAPAQLPAVPG